MMILHSLNVCAAQAGSGTDSINALNSAIQSGEGFEFVEFSPSDGISPYSLNEVQKLSIPIVGMYSFVIFDKEKSKEKILYPQPEIWYTVFGTLQVM